MPVPKHAVGPFPSSPMSSLDPRPRLGDLPERSDVLWTPAQVGLVFQFPATLLGHLLGKTLLGDIHDLWVRHIWLNVPGKDTSLQAHRGSYKTTCCTEIGPIVDWLMYPNDRIALTRETYKVAAETLATVSRHMKHPLVRSLFDTVYGEGASETVVDREGKLQFAFKRTNTKEGSMESFGILSVPTGFHCDKVIGDDFITKEDKYSAAKREKTRASVQEIQTNIVDPGGECKWVGTPWHKNDAWDSVPEALKYPRKRTGLLPDDKYQDVIFRTLADGRKVRKITKAQEAANYDLEHIADEGLMFSEIAHRAAWVPGLKDVVAHVDARFEGSDFTALTIAARLPDGRIQMTGRLWDAHVELVEDEIVTQMIAHRVKQYTQESNKDSGYTCRRIRDAARAKGLILKIPTRKIVKDGRTMELLGYHESMNKHIKITTHLLDAWGNIVWDTDTQEEYLDMIVDYSEDASNNDAPDSAASIVREYFPTSPAAPKSSISFFLPS